MRRGLQLRHPRLDFSKPLQGRKWLKLLEPNYKCGFLIQKGLLLNRHQLGFSFSSNQLGLRGPSAKGAEIACLGTSYAMGFSVNNGRNWWDNLGSQAGRLLNLGLPVGIGEWLELVDMYWQRPRGKLLLLYHPNWLAHESSYSRWRNSGKTVHHAFGWETSYLKCLFLQYRKFIKVKNKQMQYLFSYFSGQKYRFNLQYSMFYDELPYNTFARLVDLASQCERVVVLRMFCKEEVFAHQRPDVHNCCEFAQHHETNWRSVVTLLSKLGKLDCFEWKASSMDCYLPFDTHLSEKGNSELAVRIQNLMSHELA